MGFALVISIASVLIGAIVLRSPDTHANLWNEVKAGYVRTDVNTVRGKISFAIPGGIAFHNPGNFQESTVNDPGRRVYIGAGCGTCHGVDAHGGVVGTSLAGILPQTVKNVVREGPYGMPAFPKEVLSDDSLDKLATYLRGLEAAKPTADQLAALAQLTYNPSVNRELLLKGKAALRKSCGACHAPPSKAEMNGGFDPGSLLAAMVRDTNLSPEDAKLIGYYILSIRNGVDPIKGP